MASCNYSTAIGQRRVGEKSFRHITGSCLFNMIHIITLVFVTKHDDMASSNSQSGDAKSQGIQTVLRFLGGRSL